MSKYPVAVKAIGTIMSIDPGQLFCINEYFHTRYCINTGLGILTVLGEVDRGTGRYRTAYGLTEIFMKKLGGKCRKLRRATSDRRIDICEKVTSVCPYPMRFARCVTCADLNRKDLAGGSVCACV